MKPCHSCQQADAIEGERYCPMCKRKIVSEIRQRAEQDLSVRDLSRQGTDMIGRPALNPYVAGELKNQDE